ncbi:hypothetical protein [Fenollaria massiliensis]|uniref:hypothetical protein n=1 Tax=Fenollaria massiliensis TaxID=938288 RepID=UPI0012B5DE05|nr:hypothetical protein [Fenollaria massiliensis]
MMEINCKLSVDNEENIKKFIRMFSEIEELFDCKCTLDISVFTHQNYEVFKKDDND